MQLIMYFIARMLRQHLARIFVQYIANVQNRKQFDLASIQFLKRMQKALVLFSQNVPDLERLYLL